jgi:hypothetical protein
VCLLAVAHGHDRDGNGGAMVSWPTRNLLMRAWDRWSEHYATQDVMKGRLAEDGMEPAFEHAEAGQPEPSGGSAPLLQEPGRIG